MNIFRKSVAVFFALLSILTGFAALLLFNLERTAFNPGFYQQVFANQQFYEKLPAILAEALATSTPQNEFSTALQGLTVTNRENFIRALMPPETLQAMGDDALRSLFAYLDYQSESAEISLLPLKERMASEAGARAMVDLIRSQPDCTTEQIAQMTISMLNGDQFALCKPPEELLSLVTPAIQTQLRLVAQTIPDSVLLLEPSGETGQKDPRLQFQATRMFMRLSPLLPLAFLFLMTVLVVRSLHDWLSWWGIPFLAAGLLALLAGLAGEPVFGMFLLKAFEERLPNLLPPLLLDQSQQLVLAVMAQLVKPIQAQGLILTGVGLVMTLIALAMRQFSQKPND